MSKIVISGYYGFANAGDEAMLAAMIEALTDVDPTISITVISGDPADTRQRHGVKAVDKVDAIGIFRALADCDILLSGGGSLLQDVTSSRSLYYYLGVMLLAKFLGKPVMLYAQGIGPVRNPLARWCMRFVCNRMDLISVRDAGSQQELRDMGIQRPSVYVTADAVLAMNPVDKSIGRTILRQHQLEGASRVVGIAVREWQGWTNYKRVLAEVADQLVTEFGARVVFLPMQVPEDVKVSREIAALAKQPVAVLDDEYTPGELLSLAGNMDMLISIRLHALIFAALMHVPIIGISYDPKIDRFLESLYETPAGELSTVTAGDILRRVRNLWPKLGQPDPQRIELIHELRNRAYCNAEMALELLQARGNGG